MKIGFDLDGVIVDHTLAKIELVSKFGYKIKKSDTPSEVLRTILPKEILEAVQRNLYNEIHPSSFLMFGVNEIIPKIKALRVKYFLISRRKISGPAIGFLVKNDLWPAYFNESNSFFVLEKEDKDKKAKELGITHYVDDEVAVLEKLKSVNHRFLFDSHNVFPNTDFYTKVASWEDIKKQLHL